MRNLRHLMTLMVLCGCSRASDAPATLDSASSADPASPAPAAQVSWPIPVQYHAGDSCLAPPENQARRSNAELRLPRGAAELRGLVTELDSLAGDTAGRTIRVVAHPRRWDTDEAIIAVSGTARIAQRLGDDATPGRLSLCQEVGVWFDGPLAESRPPRGTARAIVIENSRGLHRGVGSY